jgi:Gas vesicle protein K
MVTKKRARRQRPSIARAPRTRAGTIVARSGGVTVTEIAELDALRREIERTARTAAPLRWNADPDEVRRSVAQLVLTLVEFIRQVLERQAIRRMEAGTLSEQQTEDVGVALMKLEEAVRDIATQFGIAPEELNLDVGPLGKLM